MSKGIIRFSCLNNMKLRSVTATNDSQNFLRKTRRRWMGRRGPIKPTKSTVMDSTIAQSDRLSRCSHLEFLLLISMTSNRGWKNCLVPIFKMIISIQYCYSIGEHYQDGHSMIKVYRTTFLWSRWKQTPQLFIMKTLEHSYRSVELPHNSLFSEPLHTTKYLKKK